MRTGAAVAALLSDLGRPGQQVEDLIPSRAGSHQPAADHSSARRPPACFTPSARLRRRLRGGAPDLSGRASVFHAPGLADPQHSETFRPQSWGGGGQPAREAVPISLSWNAARIGSSKAGRSYLITLTPQCGTAPIPGDDALRSVVEVCWASAVASRTPDGTSAPLQPDWAAGPDALARRAGWVTGQRPNPARIWKRAEHL